MKRCAASRQRSSSLVVEDMDPVECSLSALSKLDSSDFDALMRVNEACLSVLLDPVLWAWMTALTALCIAVGALIGWLKGRTTAGIIWAAVLGPIGWIIVGLGKSKLPQCIECSKRNYPGAKICRHCGVNLEQSAKRTARSRMKGADSNTR